MLLRHLQMRVDVAELLCSGPLGHVHIDCREHLRQIDWILSDMAPQIFAGKKRSHPRLPMRGRTLSAVAKELTAT